MINSKFALKKKLIKSTTKNNTNCENPNIKERTEKILMRSLRFKKTLDLF